ncbi:hypothetical protein [Nostoc sp.]|uniref:hypothetical protein n=1 Tax=Nostoc sp. TaxID=1180 RepID=UPI002FFC931F
MNNFRRFMVVSGLTLTLVVETITVTGFAQPAQAQEQAPGSVYLSCGAINTGLGATSSDANSTAAACFLQAYTSCQAATLTANFTGIDSGVRRRFFLVKEPGKCLVVNVAENYVIPQFSSDRAELCSSVQQKDKGIVIKSCGVNGDIILPGLDNL